MDGAATLAIATSTFARNMAPSKAVSARRPAARSAPSRASRWPARFAPVIDWLITVTLGREGTGYWRKTDNAITCGTAWAAPLATQPGPAGGDSVLP
jgi:hypothetical protein